VAGRTQQRDPYFDGDFQSDEPAAEFHLGDYLSILQRHWRLASVITLVCLAAGLVHYLITPKMYRATVTVQIDRRSMSIGGGAETPWLENWWNLEFYPTQYKLLESRGLAERVVSNLRLYEDPEFNPGWAHWSSTVEGGSTSELDAAVLGNLGQSLLGGLSIAPIKSTQLVEISYRSMSPTLAARVANGVAAAFIDWGIETRSESAGRASTFLGKQIDSLKGELQDKDNTLQAYSRRSDIVAMDPASNPVLQRLQALNSDYIQALSARIDKESQYNEVLSAPEEGVADTLSGGLVSTLRQELLQQQQEYATKLTIYKPDMPLMVEQRSKIEELRQHFDSVVSEMVEQARKGAQAAFQTAKRREQALAAELDRAKDETIEMGSAAVGYNNLQMEISTRRQLLDELLRRQSETDVTARLQASRESNIRIVDRALVPGGAFRPSLRKDLGLSLVLGIFLGLGCIFLVEYLDRTLKSAEEAERLLGLPVLALVPDVSDRGKGYSYGYGYGYGGRKRKRKSWRDKKAPAETIKEIELLPHTKPRHAVSEAYRALRTALLLSSAEEMRMIALTSAQSGEGKTATAANLAVVMAQLGRSVLLIDADLRKPRQHRVFRVSNRQGLVNCLTEGTDLDEVVQTTVVPGLTLMTSGTIPPNPSELLASDRMRELLERARRLFDFVIVDTPPILAVTDASLVGAQADGMVFCLNAGKVLREEARTGTDRLAMAGNKVLGLVLNRYVPTNTSDSKHYYYYQAYGESDVAESSHSAG
jgi:capsular exopolysaccharide synthesis family protein